MADEGDSDKVSLGTKVDPDLKQQVRIVSAHKGISMSQYVREAVEEKLQEDLDEGNSTFQEGTIGAD